jgi:alanine racemase
VTTPERAPSSWAGRATRAEIDLDALSGNVRALKRLLPDGTSFMAVVKANAYGHGARGVAQAAIEAGASHLAVATVGEARELRVAGITSPILILGPVDPAETPEAFALGVELTVTTPELLGAVLDAARELPSPARVHVKVDTGLRRYGAPNDLAVELARQVHEAPSLVFAGLFTHFVESEIEDLAFTREQQARYQACAATLEAEGIVPEIRHQLNSGGIMQGLVPEQMARAGIILYGISPDPALPLPAGVRPVMTLRSRIARTFDLAPGDSVGYNRTYISDQEERAALIPIGYADGYRRSFSSRGWMVSQGRRLDVIGRVSMDQAVVRLPDDHHARSGDEVIVMGDGAAGESTAQHLADLAGTNTYEIVVGISARVPRVFVREGLIVASEDRLGG